MSSLLSIKKPGSTELEQINNIAKETMKICKKLEDMSTNIHMLCAAMYCDFIYLYAKSFNSVIQKYLLLGIKLRDKSYACRFV